VVCTAQQEDSARVRAAAERDLKLLEIFAAVDALTREDVEVHRLVTEVFQLTKPLSALNEEPLRSRALEQLQKQARA
jgi:hypothetical protein